MGEPLPLSLLLGEGTEPEKDFDARLADENANALSADDRWSLAGGEVGRGVAGRGSGGGTGCTRGWVACWE